MHALKRTYPVGAIWVFPRMLVLGMWAILSTGSAADTTAAPASVSDEIPSVPPSPVPAGADRGQVTGGRGFENTAGEQEEESVPAEVQAFIRDLVLVLLPPKFEDDDDWGSEKKIQSGLDIDFDDGRIETRRRWKSVNHGSWIRSSGSLQQPDKTLTLKIFRRPGENSTEQIYRIQLLARADVSATQQQWNHGVMFWSVSADAEADVQIDVNLRVRTEVRNTESGSKLQVQPEVTHAVIRLNSFSLKRISHMKGGAAREFGEAFEGIVRMAVDRQNRKLVGKINKALAKQSDKLEFPVDPGALFRYFSPPPADAITAPDKAQ